MADVGGQGAHCGLGRQQGPFRPATETLRPHLIRSLLSQGLRCCQASAVLGCKLRTACAAQGPHPRSGCPTWSEYLLCEYVNLTLALWGTDRVGHTSRQHLGMRCWHWRRYAHRHERESRLMALGCRGRILRLSEPARWCGQRLQAAAVRVAGQSGSGRCARGGGEVPEPVVWCRESAKSSGW